MASDVTEKKNIIAALEHRRVFQDNPRPFQAPEQAVAMADAAGAR